MANYIQLSDQEAARILEIANACYNEFEQLKINDYCIFSQWFPSTGLTFYLYFQGQPIGTFEEYEPEWFDRVFKNARKGMIYTLSEGIDCFDYSPFEFLFKLVLDKKQKRIDEKNQRISDYLAQTNCK